MNSSEQKKWIRKFSELDTAKGRIIILPHAGGSASFFYELCADLSSSIECIAIQYPGRQDRFGEDLIKSIEEYADIITEVIVGLDDKPTILFGHSMGALIGYNMLVRHESDLSFVNLFLASAHNPPQNNPQFVNDSLGNDNNIIAYLKEMGGLDDALLLNQDIMKVILPAVKNDLQAVSKFFDKRSTKIQAPIIAVIGINDKSTNIESTSGWSDLTSKYFKIVQLPGGHFYLSDEHKKLAKIILKSFDNIIRI